MKKRINLLILLLICTLILTACGCKHETWLDADCVTPKTCAECGETEGEPLGHVWMAATCTDPKTCETCKLTDGEPKGHSWLEVTCTDPKTCERCKLTEGEALGHVWQEATTETPKTCETCNETEGDRIITDPRFTTAATAVIQGTWGCQYSFTGDELGLSGFPNDVIFEITLTFGNAGDMSTCIGLLDEEGFTADLTQYLIDSTYANFAAQGMSEEEANAAVQAEYNMTIEEYFAAYVEEINITELFDAITSSVELDNVYYVEGDQLYVADSWDLEMSPSEFSIEGDTLYINEVTDKLGLEPGLYRIPEE